MLAYYSPFVSKEVGDNSSLFQSLLHEKLDFTYWTWIMISVNGSKGLEEDQKVLIYKTSTNIGASAPFKKISFPQFDMATSGSTLEDW